MNVTCPGCSLNFNIIAGINEADARRVCELLGELPPPLAKVLFRYLLLFKPNKSGLTWSKILKLLSGISPDIKRGQVQRNGRIWAAPLDHWITAMEEMIERRGKLTLPMKNHGYLYDILAGMADKTEAGEENLREERRKNRQDNGAGQRSIHSILSEIRQLEDLKENSPNAANKNALQKQIDKLHEQADEMQQGRRS